MPRSHQKAATARELYRPRLPALATTNINMQQGNTKLNHVAASRCATVPSLNPKAAHNQFTACTLSCHPQRCREYTHSARDSNRRARGMTLTPCNQGTKLGVRPLTKCPVGIYHNSTTPRAPPKHSLSKFFWTTDSMRPAVAVSVLLLVRVLPLEAATRLARTKFSAHTGYIHIP